MNNYLVYCHIRPDTNEIFYIGKGKQGRIRQKSNRNTYWHNIVKKANGFISNIVASNLTEKEALNFEVLIIKKLKQLNVKLSNLTAGGDGISGYRHTEETKKKFSETRKGRPSSLVGIKFSEEHRKKISLAKLGKKQTKEHTEAVAKAKIGKPLSEETRKKISISNTGKTWTEETRQKLSVQVFCITNNTLYKSVTEASEKLNVFKGNICKCCKGILNHTGGYKFIYVTQHQALTA